MVRYRWVIAALLLLALLGCGKAREQPEPTTIPVESEPEEIQKIAEQIPPEPVEEVKEPAPTPPPMNVTKNETKKPQVQKTTTVKGPQNQTKMLSTIVLHGTVRSIEGANYDKGIVQTDTGKQYKFYNALNLSIGDKVTFELDKDYVAINMKKIEENRTRTSI